MSRERVIRQLAEAELRRYPTEAARRLERLPVRDVAEFLERQEPALAAEALRRLAPDRASEVIEALDEPHASEILTALEPALAAALVARMDGRARKRRLAALQPALAKELAELMTYPPDAAGSMMDPRAESFPPDTPVREALARIRALKNPEIQDIFIGDDDGRLVGSVSIQNLALAEPNARLDELMDPTPPRVQAFTPQDELAAIVADRRVSTIPVVDVSERLLGVIRHSDLVSATQLDATADMQTMVGVSRDERALSTAAFAVRKRLPWLNINLATAFLAAAVVGLFEDTIAQFTALAVLLPVVAGQSGNSGQQALAVTMRGLALREIRVRHWFRVVRKELAAGVVNGVAIALVTALGVYLWSQSAGLAMVIGIAMVVAMVVAGLAGASIPMLLILLRQDPAASSSIVLTTITDVLGFLTFLGLATLASGML